MQEVFKTDGGGACGCGGSPPNEKLKPPGIREACPPIPPTAPNPTRSLNELSLKNRQKIISAFPSDESGTISSTSPTTVFFRVIINYPFLRIKK
jgi:hypothetical protein